MQQTGDLQPQRLTCVIFFPMCKLPGDHDTQRSNHCLPADSNAERGRNDCKDEVH